MTETRAERRRAARDAERARKHGTQEAIHPVIVGWCADDAIEEGKQQTHDTVKKMVAEHSYIEQAGPVFWRIASGQEGHDLLDELTQPAGGPPSTEWLNNIRAVRGHLREYGGHVVVASCEVRTRG